MPPPSPSGAGPARHRGRPEHGRQRDLYPRIRSLGLSPALRLAHLRGGLVAIFRRKLGVGRDTGPVVGYAAVDEDHWLEHEGAQILRETVGGIQWGRGMPRAVATILVQYRGYGREEDRPLPVASDWHRETARGNLALDRRRRCTSDCWIATFHFVGAAISGENSRKAGAGYRSKVPYRNAGSLLRIFIGGSTPRGKTGTGG